MFRPCRDAIVQRSFVVFAMLLLGAPVASAIGAESRSAMTVDRVSGAVKVRVSKRWQTPRSGATLELPLTVSTGADGELTLRQGQTFISISAESAVEFHPGERPGQPVQRVVQTRGNAFYDIAPRKANKLRVQTPYLVAVVKGTQFSVAVAEEASTVALFEGSLQIETPDGRDSVALEAGEMAKRHRDDTYIRVYGLHDGELVRNLNPAGPAAHATATATALPTQESATSRLGAAATGVVAPVGGIAGTNTSAVVAATDGVDDVTEVAAAVATVADEHLEADRYAGKLERLTGDVAAVAEPLVAGLPEVSADVAADVAATVTPGLSVDTIGAPVVSATANVSAAVAAEVTAAATVDLVSDLGGAVAVVTEVAAAADVDLATDLGTAVATDVAAAAAVDLATDLGAAVAAVTDVSPAAIVDLATDLGASTDAGLAADVGATVATDLTTGVSADMTADLFATGAADAAALLETAVGDAPDLAADTGVTPAGDIATGIDAELTGVVAPDLEVGTGIAVAIDTDTDIDLAADAADLVADGAAVVAADADASIQADIAPDIAADIGDLDLGVAADTATVADATASADSLAEATVTTAVATEVVLDLETELSVAVLDVEADITLAALEVAPEIAAAAETTTLPELDAASDLGLETGGALDLGADMLRGATAGIDAILDGGAAPAPGLPDSVVEIPATIRGGLIGN